MKYLSMVVVVCAFIFSGCNEDEGNSPFDRTTESATYEITVASGWNNNYAPVPNGALFSPIAGAVVNSESTLWAPGSTASPGFEALAELGETAGLITEINDEIAENKALSSFTTASFGAVDTVKFQVTVNRTFPEITFASMLDPTPDWIIGVECLSFLDEEGLWHTNLSRELPVYDAGTEEGRGFTLNNPPTEPKQPIGLLQGTVAGTLNFIDGEANGRHIAIMGARRIQ
ncbi:Uncharacterised protein [BD1-7 clade bacterium]|uniref:Spondin domain-containing protein n=1 Tax=BD1-7 clade bacterium TaxID=2029982 RepID=A0A5S9PBD9_9GAMM|nr:Uncharacterised protein [BD1-7 clade bacterium]